MRAGKIFSSFPLSLLLYLFSCFCSLPPFPSLPPSYFLSLCPSISPPNFPPVFGFSFFSFFAPLPYLLPFLPLFFYSFFIVSLPSLHADTNQDLEVPTNLATVIVQDSIATSLWHFSLKEADIAFVFFRYFNTSISVFIFQVFSKNLWSPPKLSIYACSHISILWPHCSELPYI